MRKRGSGMERGVAHHLNASALRRAAHWVLPSAPSTRPGASTTPGAMAAWERRGGKTCPFTILHGKRYIFKHKTPAVDVIALVLPHPLRLETSRKQWAHRDGGCTRVIQCGRGAGAGAAGCLKLLGLSQVWYGVGGATLLCAASDACRGGDAFSFFWRRGAHALGAIGVGGGAFFVFSETGGMLGCVGGTREHTLEPRGG